MGWLLFMVLVIAWPWVFDGVVGKVTQPMIDRMPESDEYGIMIHDPAADHPLNCKCRLYHN